MLLLGIYLIETKALSWRGICIPMFIVTSLTIAKTWKQAKCPWRNECIKKMWYIHIMECSVQFNRSVVSDSLWPHGLWHARLPCLSPTLRAYSDSCSLNRWYHPTISSSVIPFSPHLQSFPSSRYFPMSQFFALGGQSIGVSASASVLSMNIQDWFPLGLTGWISLQSEGLSRVFSNTTMQKHQVFGAQLSL